MAEAHATLDSVPFARFGYGAAWIFQDAAVAGAARAAAGLAGLLVAATAVAAGSAAPAATNETMTATSTLRDCIC